MGARALQAGAQNVLFREALHNADQYVYKMVPGYDENGRVADKDALAGQLGDMSYSFLAQLAFGQGPATNVLGAVGEGFFQSLVAAAQQELAYPATAKASKNIFPGDVSIFLLFNIGITVLLAAGQLLLDVPLFFVRDIPIVIWYNLRGEDLGPGIFIGISSKE